MEENRNINQKLCSVVCFKAQVHFLKVRILKAWQILGQRDALFTEEVVEPVRSKPLTCQYSSYWHEERKKLSTNGTRLD